MLYAIVVSVLWVLAKLLYGMRVIGKENLPKEGSFIITPNHVSAFDVVMVVTARYFGKRLIVLAKEELFANWFLKWFFGNMGAVAVKRGKGDVTAINKAIEEVKAGRGALVFPEGTRSTDGELLKLKSGAFVIAAQAKADLVPCRIVYECKKPKMFKRTTVIFDKPIKYEDLNLGENYSASALRECKTMLRQRLEDMLVENKQFL